MSDRPNLPPDWQVALGAEFDKDYFKSLMDFVAKERASGQVFPPENEVFSAFTHSPFNDTKVVLIGQDPYHDVNQAHGLAFSVRPGVAVPPSLQNIYKELHSDVQFRVPNHGCLIPWAEQGVLLLNATLTVRAHQAGSHQRRGWEEFTDAAIKALSADKEHLVFILWGSYAQGKASYIDPSKHLVLKSAHPSPLSAYRGFFGNKHFSRANDYLLQNGETPIQW